MKKTCKAPAAKRYVYVLAEWGDPKSGSGPLIKSVWASETDAALHVNELVNAKGASAWPVWTLLMLPLNPGKRPTRRSREG